MMNWTVRKRIILGFSAITIIILALTIFALIRLTTIKTQTDNILLDSLPGTYYTGQFEALTTSNYGFGLSHILSEDPEQMRRYESEIQSNRNTISDLLSKYETTIREEKDRQLFSEVLKAREAYVVALDKAIEDSRTAKTEEAKVMIERQIEPSYKNLIKLLHSLANYNYQSNLEATQNIQSAVDSTRTGTLIGLLASLMLALLSGYLLIRAIDRPLAKIVSAVETMRTGDFSQRLTYAGRDEFGILAEGLNRMVNDLSSLIDQVQRSGLQVNTSANDIAASTQQQQATANEVASTTTQISATSKEISATSKELARTINEVSGVAERTAALAEDGQLSLSHMEGTMHQIMEASESINNKLAVVNEKTSNINRVITTITKVADQTNLLSLNAAIEAEKAGEYGRGFAVVASEIRRLADQTAVSTDDIEQIIKEVQSAVSAGVMGMDKFSEEVRRGVAVVNQVSEQLRQIIEQVQTLTPSVETVNEGMQSQSIGAEQNSDALVQLNESVRHTVEALQQSHAAVMRLNEASRGLQDGVSRFRLRA